MDNNPIVITQDDTSQHDNNIADDMSISSVILSGVGGAEAPRDKQGSFILISTKPRTNNDQQITQQTTTIHHDSRTTDDTDPIPEPLPPHTIIPTDSLLSFINNNLALCSYCKNGKQQLVSCGNVCFRPRQSGRRVRE